MPELKPVYLIHGEDHGAIAERRAGLRALAEREGGADRVEVLDGEAATPAAVAAALATMTLALGGPGAGGIGRVILVDGAERWKQAEVQSDLAPALAAMPPDTTLALFAREEGRVKAPTALHDAVKAAKGQIVAQATVKPWELPKWVRAQAARLGIELDMAAAKALVAQVGERQQRLLRELEKLALEREPAGPAEPAQSGAGVSSASVKITVEDVEARAARSSEQRGYELADALVAGDARAATRSLVRLSAQGERLPGLTYLMAARLRDALAVSLRLRAGGSPAEIKRGLRMPARAADRFLADVARTEPERLRAALAALADLELDSRGGSPLPETRSRMSGLHEDTLALRAIAAIVGRAARAGGAV